MWEKTDINQIEERGSSCDIINSQIESFKKGFPWMNIIAPATPEKGIEVLSDEQMSDLIKYYDKAQVHGKCKFVPASGAASRMFKDLFAALTFIRNRENKSSEKDLERSLASSSAKKLADNINDFAFYTDDLFKKVSHEGKISYIKGILENLLESKSGEGLGYGSKPKGVLYFHKYEDGSIRTAFAEHLVEAQDYMRNADDTAKLVVTISPEHRALFEEALAEVQSEFEKKYGVKYIVDFTYQDKATDTIAVDVENKPFRKNNGELLFRPGGHGALIYNLNKLEDELVLIKNIDNVSHDRFLPEISKYNKVLMGRVLQLRDQIFSYLNRLDDVEGGEIADIVALCKEIQTFLNDDLCVELPEEFSKALSTVDIEQAASDVDEKSLVAIVDALRSKLDRPIRVCGMVKNEGEPGGGPFIIRNQDGSTSLQILEGAQINKNDKKAVEALHNATHFNPVEIVCCLRNYKGERFDLLSHVDNDAGFISSKSFEGRDLKALELPGLWNGAMSDWNTAFVEVSLDTFNPVKVCLDLLRPAHQGS